jgi:SAM-dependent methyltransferase
MLTDNHAGARIAKPGVRACGACGSLNFAVDSMRPAPIPGSREAFRARCANCGLEAYQPQPGMQALSSLFNDQYYQSGYLEIEILRRRLIEQAVARLCRYLPEHCRILDFGAGTGFWAERLRALGYRVDAYETSAAARRQLEGNRFQTISSIENIDGPYDAILVMDVLGSCENPAGVLAQLSLRLSPGGRLIIRTPHFQGAWRRCEEELAFRRNETPPWYPSILWRFRPHDLESCLRRAGVTPVQTWFERQPWSLRGGWKSRVLRRACAILDRLTRNGDEFYTIGRKPFEL